MKRAKRKLVNRKFIVAVIVILLLVAGTLLLYTATRTKPDQVFRNFLEKSAKATTLETEESYSGSGGTINSKGTLDIKSKKLAVNADLACSPEVDGKTVKIDTTLQNNNGTVYMKINDASGKVTNFTTRKVFNLQTVYSKAKGKWYKITDEPGTKAQLKAGVYVSSSSIIAPDYDAKMVVDKLISSHAIEYTFLRKKGGEYIFKVTSHRDAYLKVLKGNFPKLNDPDLILDGVFDEKSTQESTITVTKDGELISESLSQVNLCVDIVKQLVGDTFQGVSKAMTGVSTPKPDGSVKIAPITSSSPIINLQKDMVI